MVKHKIRLINILVATALLLVAVILYSQPVSAQSILQNAGSGLQPRTAQTQSSSSNLSQTGRLQSNSGQSVLNSPSSSTLAVVTETAQTTADVSVTSTDLSNQRAPQKSNKSSLLLPLIISGVALLTISLFLIWRSKD